MNPDYTQLSEQELKATAYDLICKINFLQSELQKVETTLIKKQQEQQSAKTPEVQNTQEQQQPPIKVG